jgi:hypothetical protein
MGTTVSMADIVDALEMAADEMSSYVNAATGQVITVSHEDLGLAEEEPDPDLPDWQQEAVAEARQVLDSEEWLELPSKFDIDEWEMMDRFATSLSRESACGELRSAIRGNGAFRNFKSAIRRLGVEEAWFAYKKETFEGLAREWLAQHNLSVDEGRTE